MLLDKETMLEVVRNTPLVSIDLICRRAGGEVLLGLRSNEPARGVWFVPGGRILKDEPIAEAFARITQTELGLRLALEQADFKGVFEHFYPTNFAGEAGFGTHYVVLAYEVGLEESEGVFPANQHSAYRWWPESELLAAEEVHANVKAYFLA